MKKNLNKILFFILGGIFFCGMSVYATTIILSENIQFTPENVNWKVTNIEEAVNDLYEKVNDGTNDLSGFINLPWNYEYRGSEQKFTVPVSGYYKLETWGAQGGNAETTIGGYGAYSVGTIYLEKSQILYLNVGGMGANSVVGSNKVTNGGYNGGGNGYQMANNLYAGGGGGATHIATKSGLLSTLSNNRDSILIVSSGGAGGYYYDYKRFVGNSGGGYIGGYSYDSSKAGTQTSGYAFGHGGTIPGQEVKDLNNAGGGGGFYGGYSAYGELGAGGGSSYIGNTNLINKAMYCYNCVASTSDLPEEYKTITTSSVSSQPISNYAKIGDGYAKITYLGN